MADDTLIGLVDPDPYLALTLRREFPDVRTLRVFDEPDPSSAASRCAVLIVDLSGPHAAEAAGFDRPLIGVGGVPPGDEVPLDRFRAVVARPYMAQDLRRAVEELTDLKRRVPEDPAGLAGVVRTWLPPVRIGAVALAAVLETAQSGGATRVQAGVLALAFVYVTARLRALRGTSTGVWVDVAVVVALLSFSGGYRSSYLALAFVVAVSAGIILPAAEAGLAGVLISLGTVPPLVLSLIDGAGARPSELVMVLLAFPAAALAGGQTSRLAGQDPPGSSVVLLREAHRALTSLYGIARDLPRSLTLQSVAQAVLEDVLEELDVEAAVVLLLESGVVYEAARQPGTQSAPALLEVDELDPAIVDATRVAEVSGVVPAALLEAVPSARWYVAPLDAGAERTGWVLVASREGLQPTERRALGRHAREAGLATANARLFARVRDLAVDEERVRLANDLHDGVAQALAHVRLELEFLARYGPDQPDRLREDADRLAGVVQRALADVRSTIADLRAVSLAGGLAVAIHDHCRDLRLMAGPAIHARTRTSVRLEPVVEIEIFRILRTAVANAIRHAGTEEVTILLDELDDGLHLVVEDDGHGMSERYDRRAGRDNVGVRSMRERAERLGASLDVTRRRDGGTRVELVCPLDREDRAAGTGSRR